jgi:hypothetical protein
MALADLGIPVLRILRRGVAILSLEDQLGGLAFKDGHDLPSLLEQDIRRLDGTLFVDVFLGRGGIEVRAMRLDRAAGVFLKALGRVVRDSRPAILQVVVKPHRRPHDEELGQGRDVPSHVAMARRMIGFSLR